MSVVYVIYWGCVHECVCPSPCPCPWIDWMAESWIEKVWRNGYETFFSVCSKFGCPLHSFLWTRITVTLCCFPCRKSNLLFPLAKLVTLPILALNIPNNSNNKITIQIFIGKPNRSFKIHKTIISFVNYSSYIM